MKRLPEEFVAAVKPSASGGHGLMWSVAVLETARFANEKIILNFEPTWVACVAAPRTAHPEINLNPRANSR